MSKVALITGVTGQDGAYLAELLLAKGYVVHGVKRRSSSFNTGRVDHLYVDPHEEGAKLFLHYGDLTDATNLIRLVQETQPDEIYNLAAQSHVQVSFETPEYTANADALGTLRLLEAIRILGIGREGALLSGLDLGALRQGQRDAAERDDAVLIRAAPTRRPSSMPTGSRSITARPTACTPPTASCSTTKSPMRGETFVTRKITRAVAAIELGLQDRLYLGNLDAKRDWGHARDYVEGMWLILQQDEPDDYVLATGESHSVREFVELAFDEIGRSIDWRGKGDGGEGLRCARTGEVLVEIDPRYFRPTEVDLLLGDPARRAKLGWRHKISLRGAGAPRWSRPIWRLVRCEQKRRGRCE